MAVNRHIMIVAGGSVKRCKSDRRRDDFWLKVQKLQRNNESTFLCAQKNQAGGPKERQPGEGEREQDHLGHGSLVFVSEPLCQSRVNFIFYTKP